MAVMVTAALTAGLASFLSATDTASTQPTYVGSEACASCHSSQYNAWAQSGHRFKLQTPEQLSALGRQEVSDDVEEAIEPVVVDPMAGALDNH